MALNFDNPEIMCTCQEWQCPVWEGQPVCQCRRMDCGATGVFLLAGVGKREGEENGGGSGEVVAAVDKIHDVIAEMDRHQVEAAARVEVVLREVALQPALIHGYLEQFAQAGNSLAMAATGINASIGAYVGAHPVAGGSPAPVNWGPPDRNPGAVRLVGAYRQLNQAWAERAEEEEEEEEDEEEEGQ
ncbi:hypothetical protein SCUCBS95973_006244 [Sporothrix curviconia]|uniref:Uncharacterized protein n=1 Tax=Sporothrix curviconia TaxID=1260050 RepID=A0ABP0C3L2_9PEZI